MTRFWPIAVVMVCGFSLSGCYSTFRGYRAVSGEVPCKVLSHDPRGLDVAFVRAKDFKELGQKPGEGLLVVNPVLNNRSVLLIASRALAKSSCGLYPSTEVSTSDQGMVGWVLELTDNRRLGTFEEILPAEKRPSDSRGRIDEKTIRAVWARWWQVVNEGKTEEYGAHVHPVSGSVRVEGMKSRFRRIWLNLETGDVERIPIRMEIEFYVILGAWM